MLRCGGRSRTRWTAWLLCLVALIGFGSGAPVEAKKKPPEPTASPPGRMDASMATAGQSTVVLFGGRGDTTVFADTWTWDGTSWVEQRPAANPAPRYGASMAWDAVRNQVLLFGGETIAPDGSTTYLADTWIWDGVTWSQHPGMVLPPARSQATLARDPGTGELLLFGGRNAEGLLADTYLWNGIAWRPDGLTDGPTARQASGSASASEGIVLFGGQTESGLSSETYLWSGGWTRAYRSSVVPHRAEHAMADYSAGSALLFGGDGSTLLDDTWLWDGLRWSNPNPLTKPGARAAASVAYVPATGQALLFGGRTATGVAGDTWEYRAGSWTLRG